MNSNNSGEPVPVTKLIENYEYPFYLAHTTRTKTGIEKLFDKIIKEMQENNVPINSPALIVEDKFKGTETDRIICVIDPKMYRYLKENDFKIDQFNIEPYILHQHMYPKENEKYNLYIKFPNNLSLTVCLEYIIEKMEKMLEYGFWNKGDYMLNIPNKKRASDEHDGNAYINFRDAELAKNNIHLQKKIALTRFYLNCGEWPDTTFRVICQFYRIPNRNGTTSSENNLNSPGEWRVPKKIYKPKT